MQGATEESGRKTRRYPRISLPKGMSVSWHGADLQLFSRVETLGMGGLFISAPNPSHQQNARCYASVAKLHTLLCTGYAKPAGAGLL